MCRSRSCTCSSSLQSSVPSSHSLLRGEFSRRRRARFREELLVGLVELGEHRARVAKADLQALLFGFLGRAVAHVLEELPKVFFVRSRHATTSHFAFLEELDGYADAREDTSRRQVNRQLEGLKRETSPNRRGSPVAQPWHMLICT